MTHPLLAPTNAEQPRSYQRSIANGRLSFRPPAVVVDSTRRNSLICWQKRAAVWEHGFESRWGHHLNYAYLAANDFHPSHLAQCYDQGVSRAGRCCVDQCCELRVSPTAIHRAGTETVEPVPVPVPAPNPR